MAFDPITLLSTSLVVLSVVGTLMLYASLVEASAYLRWSGGAYLCLAVGFAMVLASRADVSASVRVFGNAGLMLSYGLLWKAARSFDGRPAAFELVVAGALAWLAVACLFDPSQSWRIGVTSVIVAAYSIAIAVEHRRGPGQIAVTPLQAQRWAAWVFATHGVFFAGRAAFGPTFGLTGFGPDIASAWGALLGIETVLVAVLVGVLSLAMTRELADTHHRREALEDVLTGIGNRRALFRSGGELLDASRRSGRPSTLLLMDLDGFKIVNDCHGHPAGDRLLVAFARLAHDYLPPTSLVCRLGGEEFAAVLPGADAERARAVAEEIRSLFAHLTLDAPSGTVHATVSIGVAQASGGADPADEMLSLLTRADRCLYAAKRSGRNRVVAEADLPHPTDPASLAALRRPAA